MIAIGILDELQEPRAQSIDDKTNLFPCPEALNQLLYCPCPKTPSPDSTKTTHHQQEPLKSKNMYIIDKRKKNQGVN